MFTTVGELLLALMIVFVAVFGCILMTIGLCGFCFSAYQSIRHFESWKETTFALTASTVAFVIGYLPIYSLLTITGR